MSQIPASELIVNARGAVYHLDLRPEELADTIILVGDPDRVKVVSKYFDKIECTRQHREFITHTGFISDRRISVISTGIGPDNVDIAMNEIDAVANIDLTLRQVKKDLKSLNIFRFGTSGSLQEHVAVDSLVAGTHGLGFDNVMHFYNLPNDEAETKILQAFNNHTSLNSGNVITYLYSGSETLLSALPKDYVKGITVACPGFYGPQGRILRLDLAYPGLIEKLTSFTFNEHYISNFEMESSAIYGLGKALGHQCISLNVVVANRVRKEFSKDSGKAVVKLIEKSLEYLTLVPSPKEREVK